MAVLLSLLCRLQGSVWRQLQITPDVHSAVFAWVHYRQFAVSQELLLLEVARQAIQAVKGAAAPPPNGSGSPLLVSQGAFRVAILDAHVGRAVVEAQGCDGRLLERLVLQRAVAIACVCAAVHKGCMLLWCSAR